MTDPEISPIAAPSERAQSEARVPGQRLPIRTKLAWALGSLGDNYAGNMIGQLKDPVYTVALGVPPQFIGWALALPRLLDAFVDPLVGFWSDNLGGKWGRRRPLIFVGALALGATTMMFWIPPRFADYRVLAFYFFVATLLFSAAYSLFLVPYRALGLELTSDYNERTRLQAWGMMVGLVGGLGLPWLYKLTLFFGGGRAGAPVSPDVILSGARWVGAGVGALILITCMIPALSCREERQSGGAARIRFSKALKATVRNRPFLHMLGMNFSAIVGMYSPVTVSLLVSIYLIFEGRQEAAATLTGYLGMSQMLGSLAGVPFNTAVSVRFGKRIAALLSLAVSAAGFASLLWTLVPEHPFQAMVSNVLIGWGMQGVWLMSAAMNGDVCDLDELATGQRREGLYGAVFALEQKIAFSVAALMGGYLVSRCGYVTDSLPTPGTLHRLRETLVVAPLAGLCLAAVSVVFYPLSRDEVVAIQSSLSARRPSF